MTISLEMQN